jgi:hypothetical protein
VRLRELTGRVPADETVGRTFPRRSNPSTKFRALAGDAHCCCWLCCAWWPLWQSAVAPFTAISARPQIRVSSSVKKRPRRLLRLAAGSTPALHASGRSRPLCKSSISTTHCSSRNCQACACPSAQHTRHSCCVETILVA